MPQSNLYLRFDQFRSSTNAPSMFDLPPSTLARPLPVGKAARNSETTSGRRKRKLIDDGMKTKVDDDAPRAFQRLLQIQQSRGRKPSKHESPDEKHNTGDIALRKRRSYASPASSRCNVNLSANKSQHNPDTPSRAPQIQPGEKLSEFSARVNMELPLKRIPRNSVGKGMSKKERDKLMGEAGKTKREKKMQKMQVQWRLQEARRKEKEEAEEDLADEAEAAAEWSGAGAAEVGFLDGLKTRKRAKRRRRMDDEDPWRALEAKREKPKGLHDVVQAPPNFRNLGKGKFKVKDGAWVDVANVPAAAGSLRKREELGETRKDVIERYRKMMEEKRSMEIQ